MGIKVTFLVNIAERMEGRKIENREQRAEKRERRTGTRQKSNKEQRKRKPGR
jgi:hypothetical protein